ncbi:MAG TPA: hypothetical protein VHA52_00235 [Candidatus Babeliaceae bacterium]|nr:hypothetical protein [Candidatus Babeliaceae bacterium]
MNNKDRETRETGETYSRDNDIRYRKDGRDSHKVMNDMSWLIPALLGLLVVGALAYYFLRHRQAAVPQTTTPATHHVANTTVPVATTPATPATPTTH